MTNRLKHSHTYTLSLFRSLTVLENSFIHINTKPSFVKLTHASLSRFCALSGQFTEDGSFIGQYVPGKLQPPVSPQPLNNTASAHQQQQQSPSQPAVGVTAGAGSSSSGGSGGSAAGAGGGASSAANTAAVATYV